MVILLSIHTVKCAGMYGKYPEMILKNSGGTVIPIIPIIFHYFHSPFSIYLLSDLISVANGLKLYQATK